MLTPHSFCAGLEGFTEVSASHLTIFRLLVGGQDFRKQSAFRYQIEI
jgi:hypothetical protein